MLGPNLMDWTLSVLKKTGPAAALYCSGFPQHDTAAIWQIELKFVIANCGSGPLMHTQHALILVTYPAPKVFYPFQTPSTVFTFIYFIVVLTISSYYYYSEG